MVEKELCFLDQPLQLHSTGTQAVNHLHPPTTRYSTWEWDEVGWMGDGTELCGITWQTMLWDYLWLTLEETIPANNIWLPWGQWPHFWGTGAPGPSVALFWSGVYVMLKQALRSLLLSYQKKACNRIVLQPSLLLVYHSVFTWHDSHAFCITGFQQFNSDFCGLPLCAAWSKLIWEGCLRNFGVSKMSSIIILRESTNQEDLIRFKPWYWIVGKHLNYIMHMVLLLEI